MPAADGHSGSCVGASWLLETKSFETARIPFCSLQHTAQVWNTCFSFSVHHCYWKISYVWRPTSIRAVVASHSENCFDRLWQPSAMHLREGFVEIPLFRTYPHFSLTFYTANRNEVHACYPVGNLGASVCHLHRFWQQQACFVSSGAVCDPSTEKVARFCCLLSLSRATPHSSKALLGHQIAEKRKLK